MTPKDVEDGKLPLNCPHCGRRMHFVDANSPKAPVLKSDPPALPDVLRVRVLAAWALSLWAEDATDGRPTANGMEG